MKDKIAFALGIVIFLIASCERERFNREIEIPQFDFVKTVDFADSLSFYDIFEGPQSDLSPSSDFILLELSSQLFTDYAHKQRLIKIPMGTQIAQTSGGTINFPNGTIMTKTFFYYHDERDTSLGKKIIETRLEIKNDDEWNIATYIWNESQTDAILDLNGLDTPLSWIDENGISRSTVYHVPSENECVTCHQSNTQVAPIGPTLLNLNRNVERNGNNVNQILHLQNIGVLSKFSMSQIGQIVDYNDPEASLGDRGRAYLAMNCSHCHNPNSWEREAEEEFDFRYKSSYTSTGIQSEIDNIRRVLLEGQMPLLGTTIIDEEGIALMTEYLNSL